MRGQKDERNMVQRAENWHGGFPSELSPEAIFAFRGLKETQENTEERLRTALTCHCFAVRRLMRRKLDGCAPTYLAYVLSTGKAALRT